MSLLKLIPFDAIVYLVTLFCRVLLSNIDKSRDKEILEKEIWKVSMVCDFIGVALCPYIDITIIILQRLETL